MDNEISTDFTESTAKIATKFLCPPSAKILLRLLQSSFTKPTDPEDGRHFYVIKIQDNRLLALPWRWDLKDWERGQRWSQWCSPGADVTRFLLDREF